MGSWLTKIQSRMKLLGSRPCSASLSSAQSRQAAPPSVRKEELAAVWVPWGLTKLGFRERSFSMEVSPLMPLSARMPSTGTISRRRMPASVAEAAFLCESRA